MWVELPPVGIVVLNVIAIPSIQVGISWVFTRLPSRWFRADGAIFRERSWERGGLVYERLLAIRIWKAWLPDGASWLGGFAKKRLTSRDPGYLADFQAETRRGEAAHLAQVPGVLLTLAWNPWPWAAGVIIAWAVLSNLPCILVQRHTRQRIGRVLAATTSH